jgi:hypothetical protein
MQLMDMNYLAQPISAMSVFSNQQDWTPKPQFSNGTRVPVLYTDPIPLPVLITMDKLVDKLGDSVTFHVGATVDISKLQPARYDPFLAVSTNPGDGELYVIERWDEPGFRGVKA